MQSKDFCYNPNDFPDTMNNDTDHRNQLLSPMHVSNESFLELLESMKSIQMNQQMFQQEIMHLKMLIPSSQQQMLPRVFNPQTQVQAPVTNL